MAERFKFTATNPIVSKFLTDEELASIRTSQRSAEYEFEFHSGHLTGFPIYIRPAGNTDTSNIPKFDTKNKTAANYVTIKNFANDEKLSGLSQGAKGEILNIIRAHWGLLQTLADRYWNEAPPARSVPFDPTTCALFVCPHCDSSYVVRFMSAGARNRDCKIRRIGGGLDTEAPVIRCRKPGCTSSLELVSLDGRDPRTGVVLTIPTEEIVQPA